MPVKRILKIKAVNDYSFNTESEEEQINNKLNRKKQINSVNANNKIINEVNSTYSKIVKE